MLRFVGFIFVVVTIFTAIVYADQITLKNGDRISGTVVKADGKKLTVRTDAMGEITIDWSAVQAVTSGDRLHIGLKNGQKLEGPVTAVNASHFPSGENAGADSFADEWRNGCGLRSPVSGTV